MKKELLQNILKEGIKNGGFTIDKNGKAPKCKSGYVVSDFGKEKTYLLNDKSDMLQLEKDIILYFDYIQSEDGANVGAWIEDGVLFLDISRIYQNKKEALKVGKKNRQLAIYDIKNDKSINIIKVFYTVHEVKKDFKNIIEFNSMDDLQRYYNIKNGYQYIIKDIDSVTESTALLKDKYIICKNEI